ncbi:Vacuolar protein sorting-associated protein 52 [Extremus antarcticus]|uniref:Vacuolar protein sorting-associated protein 52 n=1 Tax=Extremus antarcticus TaxID=702011 RepID=A0AAJ0LVC0_9PEZI|nr:Vacuolar protein sorting-associated protein 52 [Extremus antarcticus]
MWLERFSGQTSQSVQLGPSTIPRRPGLSPRTSSLSASSLYGSTESLPATARIPNGSSLKHELGGSPAADVADPLEVLRSIIGTAKIDGDNGAEDLVQAGKRPEALETDIEFGDLSLEEFASKAPIVLPTLQDARSNGVTRVVEDFEKEKDKFADLHKSILACDEVLKSVETYLTSFRADLANVSAEIESLQSRSTSLNNKLDNRRAVEKVLGPEVEAMTIPPGVVRKITEGVVDDSWVQALQELEKRSRAIDAKLKEGKDIKALQDIRPFIDNVSNKAVERIRDYVVAQIKALRSPSINAQVIQYNSFLRYKDVFAFLAKRQAGLAEEISQAYINTMRWYYSSHFGRYKAALEKLNIHAIDQNDAIATEGSTRGGKGASYDAFSIGRRMDVLRTTNDTAIPSHAAEEDKSSHYLEVSFRAFNLALVDNACAEYSFLAEFFAKQPFQTTHRKFNEIFQPVFELGQALTKQLTEHSYDALGILACVRLNQHFAFELQRRKVPAGESYINSTNMLLWPRFQIVIDSHCDSIRKATTSLSGKPSGSALSLTSSPAASTTAPHPLTQRFANFVQGILALSSEAGDDEPVSNSIGRLRNDFEGFLTKLSKGISEARKRQRFLYNNYSLVCTIIAETEGKLADELKRYYLEKRESQEVES